MFGTIHPNMPVSLAATAADGVVGVVSPGDSEVSGLRGLALVVG